MTAAGARLAERRAFRRLATEAAGGTRFASHGELAPGSVRITVDIGGTDQPVVQCGACGLLTTSAKAQRFHRTRDDQCLNPETAETLYGNAIQQLAYVTTDIRPIWGWPRGLLARPLSAYLATSIPELREESTAEAERLAAYAARLGIPVPAPSRPQQPRRRPR